MRSELRMLYGPERPSLLPTMPSFAPLLKIRFVTFFSFDPIPHLKPNSKTKAHHSARYFYIEPGLHIRNIDLECKPRIYTPHLKGGKPSTCKENKIENLGILNALVGRVCYGVGLQKMTHRIAKRSVIGAVQRRCMVCIGMKKCVPQGGSCHKSIIRKTKIGFQKIAMKIHLTIQEISPSRIWNPEKKAGCRRGYI